MAVQQGALLLRRQLSGPNFMNPVYCSVHCRPTVRQGQCDIIRCASIYA